MSIGDHEGSRRIPERPAPTPAATPKVGTRSIVLEFTEADIRRLAGAPHDAAVEMRPGRDLGPNGRDSGTVVVKWKEPA